MSVQNTAKTPAARQDLATRADSIREALKGKLAELSEGKLRADEIDSGAQLLDYGYVDSLSAVMFLAYVEERWGVRIDDMEVLEKYHSLDRIVERLLESA